MKAGSKAGYSVQTFFRDQKKILGSKACTDYTVMSGFLKDFYFELNKRIIRDGYEWKIGSRGGFLRISKSRRGEFYWHWDRRGNLTQLFKKNLWSLRPVVGWQTAEIGIRGLRKWIIECKLDPYKKKYDVVNKFPHRVFK